jgi:hypothetical protein
VVGGRHVRGNGNVEPTLDLNEKAEPDELASRAGALCLREPEENKVRGLDPKPGCPAELRHEGEESARSR